jgi:hypothetical protein
MGSDAVAVIMPYNNIGKNKSYGGNIMKKISKLIAFLMAVVMMSVVMPMSAFAAVETLNKFTNTLNSDYYNISLENGNNFIHLEYQNVYKDSTHDDYGVMNVMENEDITVVMNDGAGCTSSVTSAYGNELGWHYGSSGYYVIASDYDFSMTDGTYSFEVSDFKKGSSVNYNNGKGGSIKTTFTLAGGLPAGDYTFTVSYKYQMKKNNSTNFQIISSDTIKIHVESYKTTPVGGSIRVGENSGLRFGFQTDKEASSVEEYGFIYAVGDVENLTEETSGVVKKVATNYIVHNEGEEDEYTTFNLVFRNIPKSSYNTNITARSYVVIDGETYYSAQRTYNFYDIATQIVGDGGQPQDLKDAVQNMLDAE